MTDILKDTDAVRILEDQLPRLGELQRERLLGIAQGIALATGRSGEECEEPMNGGAQSPSRKSTE